MMVAWRYILLLLLFCSFGCVNTQTDSFLIVRAGFNDTPEDLAEKHLGDRDQAWRIRDINDVDELSLGQQIVIPLQPIGPGGLHADGAQAVPILVYHGFSSEPVKTKTVVSRQNFRDQMLYLRDNGYHVISMDEFFDFLDFNKELPPKSVVLTFDDGWCSLYEIGFPILREYGYTATLFLYTDLIHANTCLSWDQVREMQKSGFTIGSHGKTHRDLSGPVAGETYSQYFEALRQEVASAEDVIRKQLNITPVYFAYPYGSRSDLLIAFLKKKGYRGGFKVAPGGNPFYTDKFQIRRSVIYSDFSISDFAQTLDIFSGRKQQ